MGMPNPLKASEKKRFALMRPKVARLTSMAVATSSRTLRINTTSAVSTAICAPAPMATPRSAAASAGESLTPSPTMATTWPWSMSDVTFRALSSGRTLASTREMPHWRAMAWAVRSLSPVSIQTSMPRFDCKCETTRAASSLIMSATPIMPTTSPDPAGGGFFAVALKSSATRRRPPTAAWTKTTVAPSASRALARASRSGPRAPRPPPAAPAHRPS
mmetsp:Transcript_28822/g.94334  ORF Transcript_28822/g.94334 Transcript_28822/m.94334 type:complete len:217 (-) Transcript_28822:24-674(-)